MKETRHIKVYDKGEMIFEGEIKQGHVKKIMDLIWDSRLTAVLGRTDEDEVQ